MIGIATQKIQYLIYSKLHAISSFKWQKIDISQIELFDFLSIYHKYSINFSVILFGMKLALTRVYMATAGKA